MRAAAIVLALFGFACSSPSASSDGLGEDGSRLEGDRAGGPWDVLANDGSDAAMIPELMGDDAMPAADGEAACGPADCRPHDVVGLVWPEAVALQVVDGLPLIAGSYDDSASWPFVLDTLSQICFVDDDLIGDFLYHEVTATFGTDTLVDLLVKGREMAPDEIYLGLDIGGLVGQSFFQQRFVVMDYPGQQAYTFDASVDLAKHPVPGYEGAPVAKVSVAQQNAFPVVAALLAPGVEVPLLADTSSRISVITQSVFDQLDDGTLPQVEGYRFTSKYGEDAAFVTRLPQVTVGERTVVGLEAVVIPDEHHLVAVLEPSGVFVEGYLGAQFWNRFVLAIDAFGGDEFTPQVFTLVGDGSAPGDWAGRWHKVGVELAWVDGAVLVDMVYAGSDAQLLGVEVGDTVLMIDGAPADELTLTAARDALRGVPGQTVELVVSKVLSDEPWAEAVKIEEILP